jgi:hypothetical protein
MTSERSRMTSINNTDELNQKLEQLVAQACSYPAKSLQRRRVLNELVRVVKRSGKLWNEGTPYYHDALQQTWLFFCRNIEAYDPKKGSVITWFDNHLKWRLKDLRDDFLEEQARIVSTSGAIADDKSADWLDGGLPASPHLILEETYEWVMTDPDGELRNTCIKNRPDVTCQILILRRLPPETQWQQIAQEFNLPFSTAPNFYKRECLPRLRNFARRRGYLM